MRIRYRLALRNLQSSTQGVSHPLCSSLLPCIGIMCLVPYLVLLCGIVQWHDGVGPVGVGNCTYQTHSLLVLIAEEAEGFMVLGAEALISDLPLDGLELLGNFHHAAQLSIRSETAVAGRLSTYRTREVPL